MKIRELYYGLYKKNGKKINNENLIINRQEQNIYME